MNAQEEIVNLHTEIEARYHACVAIRDTCLSDSSRRYYDGTCWVYALVFDRLSDIIERLGTAPLSPPRGPRYVYYCAPSDHEWRRRSVNYDKCLVCGMRKAAE